MQSTSKVDKERPLAEGLLQPEPLPYSMDHGSVRRLRLYLELFGLWRPYNSKLWLPWQALNLVSAASFLLIFLSVAANLDLALVGEPVDQLIRTLTELPVRFSTEWHVFIPSVCLNALPVAAFHFTFHYLNAHFDWRLNSRTGRDSVQIGRIDADVHFNRILAKIPDLYKVRQLDFEAKMRRHVLFLSGLHFAITVTATCVECGAWRRGWALVYFLWVWSWSAAPVVASLVFTVVCEAHLSEYEEITAYVGSCDGLSRVWKMCRKADERLSESSGKFRLYFLFPATLTIMSLGCILAAAVRSGAEQTNPIVASNQLWILCYVTFYLVVFLYGMSSAASVTECASRNLIRVLNDYGVAACSEDGEAMAEMPVRRREVEHLMTYVQTLSSGFRFFGVRVDRALLTKYLTFISTMFTFALRHWMQSVRG